MVSHALPSGPSVRRPRTLAGTSTSPRVVMQATSMVVLPPNSMASSLSESTCIRQSGAMISVRPPVSSPSPLRASAWRQTSSGPPSPSPDPPVSPPVVNAMTLAAAGCGVRAGPVPVPSPGISAPSSRRGSARAISTPSSSAAGQVRVIDSCAAGSPLSVATRSAVSCSAAQVSASSRSASQPSPNRAAAIPTE